MTPEFLAYKAELNKVARSIRLTALSCWLAALVIILLPYVTGRGAANSGIGYVFLALGVTCAAVGVYLRSQWVKNNPYTGPR